MNVFIRRRGDRSRYLVVDADCIGRECLAPGRYYHRGATLGGSQNTGGVTDGCLTNMNHGCPNPKPAAAPELARARKGEGMRVIR